MLSFPLLGRSRFWAVLSLLLICSLLVPSAARAGSYPMTSQTGGTSVAHTDGNTYSFNYAPTSAGYGGSAGTGWHPSGSANDASCTGTISTTFTWTPAYPGEPPPSCAILTQTCTARYDTVTGGSCDDGLGDTGGGVGYGKTVSKTLYTVVSSPGASYTATCSPSASISGPANYMGGANGTVSVYYSASLAPVLLTLSGTTKDSSHQDNILIGQGCTGSLSASPATLSGWQWTISGDTFKSFVTGTNGSKPYGRVNYLSSADLANPSPHWFWKRGDDFGSIQTVSCTAQASINNVPIGTVTGQKTVSVWRPYFKFNAVPQGVNIVGTPGTPGVEVVGNIAWNGSVGTPNLFRSYWGSAGIWQFTQLCNLYRYAPPPFYVLINTGGPVLDAEFNYSSKQGAPWPADSTDAVPDQRSDGDAPTMGLFAHDNATINDSFQTYMMYQPPGNDVQWAPLNKMGWTWQCNINYVSTPGQPSHYNPNPPGTITVLDNAATASFPTWEDYYPDTSGS